MAAAVLKLGTFRIGETRKSGEALRIAVTRRPPRGVPRARWHELFDAWFPLLAPSPALFAARPAAGEDAAAWRRFVAAYEREMKAPDARHALELLAALARRAPISVGCFCADESRCHRSVLKRLIEAAARA